MIWATLTLALAGKLVTGMPVERMVEISAERVRSLPEMVPALPAVTAASEVAPSATSDPSVIVAGPPPLLPDTCKAPVEGSTIRGTGVKPSVVEIPKADHLLLESGRARLPTVMSYPLML